VLQLAALRPVVLRLALRLSSVVALLPQDLDQAL
jgi:hypothetical protein